MTIRAGYPIVPPHFQVKIISAPLPARNPVKIEDLLSQSAYLPLIDTQIELPVHEQSSCENNYNLRSIC